jgi:hypothetical protein
MVIHTCNPSTWEAETGRLLVQSQPGLNNEFDFRLHNKAVFQKTNILKTHIYTHTRTHSGYQTFIRHIF